MIAWSEWERQSDLGSRAPEPLSSVPENLSLEISQAAIILYDLESTVTQKDGAYRIEWTEQKRIS